MNNIRKIGDNKLSVTLLLFVFKEGDHIISYAPALDLSSYGPTEQESLQSFHRILDDFIKYSVERTILVDNLLKLGWKFEHKDEQSELDSFGESRLDKIHYSHMPATAEIFQDTREVAYV